MTERDGMVRPLTTNGEARLSFGPIRAQRIGMSVWLTALYCTELSGIQCVIAAAVTVAIVIRLLITGLYEERGQVIVRNLFRTRRFDSKTLESIQFTSRLISAISRLNVVPYDGENVPVNGVSIYSSGPRFPWQRPQRRLLEVDRFLAAHELPPATHRAEN